MTQTKPDPPKSQEVNLDSIKNATNTPTDSSDSRHSPIAHTDVDQSTCTSQTTSASQAQSQLELEFESSNKSENEAYINVTTTATATRDQNYTSAEDNQKDTSNYSPYKYSMIPSGPGGDSSTTSSDGGACDDGDYSLAGYQNFNDGEETSPGHNWPKINENRRLFDENTEKISIVESNVETDQNTKTTTASWSNTPHHISNLYSKALDLPPPPKDSINNENYNFSLDFSNLQPNFADFSKFNLKNTFDSSTNNNTAQKIKPQIRINPKILARPKSKSKVTLETTNTKPTKDTFTTLQSQDILSSSRPQPTTIVSQQLELISDDDFKKIIKKLLPKSS